MKRKVIVRLIQWLLIVYCIIGIGVYYLQESLMFHPEPLDREYKFVFDKPFREINLEYNKQSNLNIIQFTVPDSIKKGVVLYFHGNMKNVEYYAPLCDDFLRRNFEVWMIDYPGFGKSTGPVEEQQFYHYAEQLYKLADKSFDTDSIIIYGKSLGTGIAAYTASKYPAKRLILETPYFSFTSLGAMHFPIYPVSRMIRFRLPTNEYIRKVKMPVTIFHGTADKTIPLRNAEKLIPLLKESDKFIVIENGTHNGLQKFERYQAVLDTLLN